MTVELEKEFQAYVRTLAIQFNGRLLTEEWVDCHLLTPNIAFEDKADMKEFVARLRETFNTAHICETEANKKATVALFLYDMGNINIPVIENE